MDKYYKRGHQSEHVAKLHRERTEKLIDHLRQIDGLTPSSGEAQVVFGSQLSLILLEWEKDWIVKRNPDITAGIRTSEKVMGPRDWLHEMTGLNPRTLYALFVGEHRFVPLSRADLILTVIDQSQLLSNGTIHVIPNPKWSPEQWLLYMQERGC